jgi:uncharacterized SAM-binding protein YcdF (DUF218 family)
MDMGVECWSKAHLTWALGLGIPMFVIWVCGMPLMALFLLFLNRNSLEDPKTK